MKKVAMVICFNKIGANPRVSAFCQAIVDCDGLVTGDVTHFRAGFGKSVGGVVINSPRMLAESLLR